jgi:phosphoglucosamine mutase
LQTASKASSERQLFGTDGIRGVAGEYPLDEKTVFAIGRALGLHMSARTRRARMVIGQDTRESSRWISDALALGLSSARVDVESAGVITTPGVAYLARTGDFVAGIVISASHNPWQDNGIKVFGHDGYKLPDEEELEIEDTIFDELQRPQDLAARSLRRESSLPGSAALRRRYLDWLLHNITVPLRGLKAVVDCANGAACELAAELFRACGVETEVLHNSPDGRNINEGCGALKPEVIAGIVAGNRQFDLGITFDGDCDRALFCDGQGNIVNGDGILLLQARAMQARGALENATVVATTMSNMGLEAALRSSGIRMLRAPVGDKYVLEEMKKTGATLGGEQSGHIIFRDGDSTTGDGLLTALRLMQVMAESGRSLHQLTADLKVFPQIITNVRVRERVPFEQVPEIAAAIRAAESELDGNGRVVVRYSGTEALARVMIEAESQERMRRLAGDIAGAIEKALGAD